MWQSREDDYISLRAAALWTRSQKLSHKKAPLDGSGLLELPKRLLAGVVEFELNRVGGHVDLLNLATFQVDIAFDHVLSKHAAAG